MYVADERFTAYYDKNVKGGTEFLRDAILIYLGMK
jgi:TipAS antibiotic-recognition domain